MNTDRLVAQIRREMDRRLLTQAETARLAGISAQRLNSLLTGRHHGLKTIRILLQALGLRGAA